MKFIENWEDFYTQISVLQSLRIFVPIVVGIIFYFHAVLFQACLMVLFFVSVLSYHYKIYIGFVYSFITLEAFAYKTATELFLITIAVDIYKPHAYSYICLTHCIYMVYYYALELFYEKNFHTMDIHQYFLILLAFTVVGYLFYIPLVLKLHKIKS